MADDALSETVTSPQASLLTLPPELRLRIYSYLFGTDGGHAGVRPLQRLEIDGKTQSITARSLPTVDMQFLRVSHACREEALPIFCTTNTFLLHDVGNDTLSRNYRLLNATESSFIKHVVCSGEVGLGCRPFENIMCALRSFSDLDTLKLLIHSSSRLVGRDEHSLSEEAVLESAVSAAKSLTKTHPTLKQIIRLSPQARNYASFLFLRANKKQQGDKRV